MARLWLTYSWEDNKNQDVDFIAKELINVGLEVSLDRWNLEAGHRLWEQIEKYITNPEESDAWLILATQNSLASEACKEEFYYALDRALESRGKSFPVIGLFPATVDSDIAPAGLSTRLCVSLTDPDWKERIKAATEGRSPEIESTQIEPYYLKYYADLNEGYERKFAIELRPRAGTWGEFIVGIPMKEKDTVRPSILHGPSNVLPKKGVLFMTGEGISEDGSLWCIWAQNEATPTQSYYLFCDSLPTMIAFGDENNPPQKKVFVNRLKND